MKLSCVIPCYNEERSIGSVLASLPSGIDEVLVVDNNSDDHTARIAKRMGARIIMEKTKGYGAALKAGFAHAKGDIITTFDGDGQHPAEKIFPMMEYLLTHKLDFVSGTRFPLSSPSMGKIRIMGNTFLTLTTNMLFSTALKDSQSGMWTFKRTVLDAITLEGDDMTLSEEIKIKVLLHPTLRFAEYPIPFHPRQGQSKLSVVKHGAKNFLFLIALRMRQK